MEDRSRNRKLKKKFKAKDRENFKYVPGNQQEGQGFVNRRKEKIYHEYKRLKRKEVSQGFDVQKIYEELENSGNEEKKPQQQKSKKRFDEKKKVSRFSKAQREYQKKAEERKRKAEEMARKKKEKEDALAKYKEKKKHRFLKLCKRTSRGQPVLNNQVQLLLEKLQKQRAAESQASTS